MMSGQSKEAPKEIHFELLQGIGDGRAYLTQTVPLVVWNNVALIQKANSGLTLFDRFTLECLLQLGTCDVEDLCEVLSIDEALSLWWLEMFEMRGMARRMGETTFAPNIDLCKEALTSNFIAEKNEVIKTILWFPQSGEMVVMNPQDAILKKLSKIDPFALFPFSDEVSSQTRSELIKRSLDQSLLYGSDADSIEEAIDRNRLDSKTCAAYLLEMDLDKIGQDFADLNVYGFRSQRGEPKRRESREIKRCSIRLPILRVLIRASQKKIDDLSNSLLDAMKRKGLLQPELRGNHANAILEYKQAQIMAEKEPLTLRKRIRFNIGSETIYEVPLELVPADENTQLLINLDSAVSAFMAAELSNSCLEAISAEYNLLAADISLRLWELRYYKAIYELRESRDFFE